LFFWCDSIVGGAARLGKIVVAFRCRDQLAVGAILADDERLSGERVVGSLPRVNGDDVDAWSEREIRLVRELLRSAPVRLDGTTCAPTKM
jgi:hypothetical protein